MTENNKIRKILSDFGLEFTKPNMKKREANAIPLESVVDGYWQNEMKKDVFIQLKYYPYGSMVGSVRLYFEEKFDLLLSLQNIPSTYSLRDIVFIDIETSNLGFGSGSFVFMIGMSQFLPSRLVTKVLFCNSPAFEVELITLFDDMIKNNKLIISYNGKSFDLPFLKGRFLIHKLKSDIFDRHHMDLYHLARNIWKYRLENIRLSDIEQDILNFERSNNDIPGWMVPQIYFDYIKSKNPGDIENVFYHNEMDVLSLAALFLKTNNLINNEFHQSVDPNDLAALGKIFSRSSQIERSVRFFQSGYAMGITSREKSALFYEYSTVLKKQEKIKEWLELAKKAAFLSHHQAQVDLAIYFEHKEKNYEAALFWTLLALKKKKKFDSKAHRDLIKRKNRIIRKVVARNEKQQS